MNIRDRFKKITTFIFDIDGVLTDGALYVMDTGIARRMSIKDGYAIQLAIKRGYRIVIISGAESIPAAERLKKLGIHDIFMAVMDKKAVIEKWIATHQLDAEEILFMGDDMPDLPAMSVVGLPSCPADAASEIRQVVKYVSPFAGGNGCARDVIETVLKLNDHWDIHAGVASK